MKTLKNVCWWVLLLPILALTVFAATLLLGCVLFIEGRGGKVNPDGGPFHG